MGTQLYKKRIQHLKLKNDEFIYLFVWAKVCDFWDDDEEKENGVKEKGKCLNN